MMLKNVRDLALKVVQGLFLFALQMMQCKWNVAQSDWEELSSIYETDSFDNYKFPVTANETLSEKTAISM